MDKNTSLKITSEIASVIATSAVAIDYTNRAVSCGGKNVCNAKELRGYKEAGLLGKDFELFYVIKSFLDKVGVYDKCDAEYLRKLFSSAKKYTKTEFESDPYIGDIKIPVVQKGDNLLMNAWYERGEIFQYDMPELDSDIVVPKLAFCTDKVYFPSIYEGVVPWVSVCPSEVNSMKPQIDAAHGRCLILGLGLGYYPYLISEKENVDSVTIIEISENIIDIFNEYILPQFGNKDKIKVVRADAVEYMNNVKKGEYDFLFADIWENQVDGAPLYLGIKRHETRLPDTEFTYWIGKEIEWFLKE